jgi:hypothetical protein
LPEEARQRPAEIAALVRVKSALLARQSTEDLRNCEFFDLEEMLHALEAFLDWSDHRNRGNAGKNCGE